MTRQSPQTILVNEGEGASKESPKPDRQISMKNKESTNTLVDPHGIQSFNMKINPTQRRSSIMLQKFNTLGGTQDKTKKP